MKQIWKAPSEKTYTKHSISEMSALFFEGKYLLTEVSKPANEKAVFWVYLENFLIYRELCLHYWIPARLALLRTSVKMLFASYIPFPKDQQLVYISTEPGVKRITYVLQKTKPQVYTYITS